MVTRVGGGGVRTAITAVAVLDVKPHFLTLVAQSAVILRASEEPGLELRVLREEFELGDVQPLVQRLPRHAGIGRPVNAAIIADEHHIRINRAERDRVLVRMDRIAGAFGADVRPRPCSAG